MPLVRPGTGAHSYVHQGTRIDLNDQARAIGTQIAAIDKGFLPFDRLAADTNQLRADYERLRLSHELSREIAAERDTHKLLDKILVSVFKFIRADRGVILLIAHDPVILQAVQFSLTRAGHVVLSAGDGDTDVIIVM